VPSKAISPFSTQLLRITSAVTPGYKRLARYDFATHSHPVPVFHEGSQQ
jgi:hypothetical protein